MREASWFVDPFKFIQKNSFFIIITAGREVSEDEIPKGGSTVIEFLFPTMKFDFGAIAICFSSSSDRYYKQRI